VFPNEKGVFCFVRVGGDATTDLSGGKKGNKTNWEGGKKTNQFYSCATGRVFAFSPTSQEGGREGKI